MASEAFGFIGLGAMGAPMAANIRRALPPTTPLYIYDINPAACASFAAAHSSHGPIHTASSAKDLATHAATLVSIVNAAPDVRAVYLDARAGVVAAPPNARRLMLECSTIDVATTRAIGEELKGAGRGTFIDAPVSGGVPAATTGTLSFLLGAAADDALRGRVDAAVAMMGDAEKVFYLGGLGNGLGAKIVNNYLAGVNILAAAEALNFGVRAGIDAKSLWEVVRASTGQSFMLDKVCPVPGVDPAAPSSRGYEGGFRATMMPKDMGLGVDMAERLGVRPSTGKVALGVYEEVAAQEGMREKDASVVYRYLGGPE